METWRAAFLRSPAHVGQVVAEANLASDGVLVRAGPRPQDLAALPAFLDSLVPARVAAAAAVVTAAAPPLMALALHSTTTTAATAITTALPSQLEDLEIDDA